MNAAPPKPKHPTLLSSFLAALLLLPGLSPAARAEVDCLQTYVNCVQAAADLDNVSRFHKHRGRSRKSDASRGSRGDHIADLKLTV